MDNLLEVKLTDADCFLKIKETLTRIGILSKKDKTLYQSCHILHKKGLYYIVHFKEMFILDKKYSSINEEDICRRNAIALLLEDWNLLSVVDRKMLKDASLHNVTVLAFKDKANWTLKSKYLVGTKKKAL
jgi:hypothetical protein